MIMEKPITPCIKKCKLENDICIGCKRTKDEIIIWKSLTNEERLVIMTDIKTR